jgi:hypothetical protein
MASSFAVQKRTSAVAVSNPAAALPCIVSLKKSRAPIEAVSLEQDGNQKPAAQSMTRNFSVLFSASCTRMRLSQNKPQYVSRLAAEQM